MATRGYVNDALVHWTGRDKTDSEAFAILRTICEEKVLRLSFCPNYVDTQYQPETAMACFTDIPLRFSGEHTRKFGRCGIAFHKSNMIGYGSNPVLYTTSHHFAKIKEMGAMLEQMKEMEGDREWRAAIERYSFTRDQTLAVLEVMEFLQEYAYQRRDEREYVTYYQREWRLTFRSLPLGKDDEAKPGTSGFYYRDHKAHRIFRFAQSDVDFIVVPMRFWCAARTVARSLGCKVKVYELSVC